MFPGRYVKSLDGWRIAVPAEWARVFRAGGGVVAFAPGEGRLALTTRREAESAADAKGANFVSCKMDERGRTMVPREFRHLFAKAKIVSMTGKVRYIEINLTDTKNLQA